jgi:hypothetical protein
MFDQRAHVVRSEILTELILIVAPVTDEQLQVAGVAPGDLHLDSRIVCLPRRTINVEDCVGLDIDHQRHFQLAKRVVCPGDE